MIFTSMTEKDISHEQHSIQQFEHFRLHRRPIIKQAIIITQYQ